MRRYVLVGWLLLAIPLVALFVSDAGLGTPLAFVIFVVVPLFAATAALLGLRRKERPLPGWLLLGVVIVYLGMLVAGVFEDLHAQTILPGSCYPSEGFSCGAVRYDRAPDGATASLTLTSERAVTYTGQGIANAPGVANGTCSVSPASVGAGGDATVSCALRGAFPPVGEKVRVLVGLSYESAEGPGVLALEATGPVTT